MVAALASPTPSMLRGCVLGGRVLSGRAQRMHAHQRLSPAARHMVETQRIDVSGLAASTKGVLSKEDVIRALGTGRIVPDSMPAKASVAAAVAPAATPTSDATRPSASAAAESVVSAAYTDTPSSNMRKVIAKRLTASKAEVPHLYASIECEIDAMLAFRSALKRDMGVTVSVNDLVIKAAALALRDVPEANAQWSTATQSIRSGRAVDISVAVATPTGLITPIVTGADKRGLDSINSTVKDLATRARDGKLKPEEYQGGSFTISNLGMFGIAEFSAVINPPQACILAVGGGIRRVLPPAAKGGKPRVATVLTVKLSADVRVVDERIAALFLQVRTLSRLLCASAHACLLARRSRSTCATRWLRSSRQSGRSDRRGVLGGGWGECVVFNVKIDLSTRCSPALRGGGGGGVTFSVKPPRFILLLIGIPEFQSMLT